MITLCSIFRNSARYMDRYWEQIDELCGAVDVRVISTWGDSEDDTYELLKTRAMVLHEYHHGGPAFGSVDHGPRWDQIARVVRHTLDMVGDPGEALIWVESDLLWRPATMLKLLDDLEHVESVAPMAMACGGHDSPDRFYDIWGYRQGGIPFAAFPPYYTVGPDPNGLVKIDSCGSCFVTRGDAWKDWSGHWPFRAAGELWLDPNVATRHP